MKKFIEIPAGATVGVTIIVQGDKIIVVPIDDKMNHLSMMHALLLAFISLVQYSERIGPEARSVQQTIRCVFKELDLEEVAETLGRVINKIKDV
jgi:hypothetical protein